MDAVAVPDTAAFVAITHRDGAPDGADVGDPITIWAVRCYPEPRRPRARGQRRSRSRSRDRGQLARDGEHEDRAHRTVVVKGNDREVGVLFQRLAREYAEIKPRRVDAVAWVHAGQTVVRRV